MRAVERGKGKTWAVTRDDDADKKMMKKVDDDDDADDEEEEPTMINILFLFL